MRYSQTVFSLDSSEARLSFLIKMGAFKAGQMEDALFAFLGKQKQCKIQHRFCSQIVRRIFLSETIPFIYIIAETVKKL